METLDEIEEKIKKIKKNMDFIQKRLSEIDPNEYPYVDEQETQDLLEMQIARAQDQDYGIFEESYDDFEMEHEKEFLENDLQKDYNRLYKFQDCKRKLLYFQKYQELNFRYKFLVHGHENINDLLGRKKQAKELLSIAQNRNIAIYGAWGSGKSTFLDYIDKELEEKGEKSIQVDASEYDDYSRIWTRIYGNIRSEFFREKKLRHGIKYLWKLLCYNFQRHIGTVIYRLLWVVIAMGVLFSTKCIGVEKIINLSGKSYEKYMNNGLTWVAIFMLLYNVIVPIANACFKTSDKIVKKMAEKVSRINIHDKLGYREDVKEQTQIIMDAWNEHIYLLVDELDRATPETIYNFFQAIHLFMDDNRINFIFAIDYDWLQASLQEYLSHMLGDKKEKEILTFVEKYTDITVFFSRNEAIHTCIKSLLTLETFTEQEINLVQELANKRNDITIRHLKRLVDMLIFSKKNWYDTMISEKDSFNTWDDFFTYSDCIIVLFSCVLNPEVIEKRISQVCETTYK